MKKPVTEIIITKEGRDIQIVIGGAVVGKGPIVEERTAYRFRDAVVRDLTK